MLTGGAEWKIGGVGGLDVPGGQATQATEQPAGSNFGDMLGHAVSSLQNQQNDAASASQSLVDGTATDPTQVVMAVERARLGMQLASQVRNKAVEAYTEIFHTQV
jgi:flagellar hook-basal body complex protein FliE